MGQRQTLPVLPLRGTVMFPGITAPIAAGRPGTLRAIETALKGDRLVFAVAQRDSNLQEINFGCVGPGPLTRPSGLRVVNS